jgi:hypothetical protein
MTTTNRLKKILCRVSLALIPFGGVRKLLRKKLFSKSCHKIEQQYAHSRFYGKIYFPTYNLECRLSDKEPEIYNKDGQKMETFFIRDSHFAHNPCGTSKYFTWDRYNIGLDTHFYTHNAMLQTMGSPTKKYGMLVESEAIVPEDYKIFDMNKGLDKDFDLIFTYSDKILDKYDNARFYPACASPWYGRSIGGGIMSKTAYEDKTRNISMLSSNKSMCKLHDFRVSLANKLKKSALVDTYGSFGGGLFLKDVSTTLANYRYSIVIENFISPYYFTERITNCFTAMTIPIYLGSSKIGQFFNEDGIIQINMEDFDKIDEILKQCSPKDYAERLLAILDNYNRVQEYLNIEDKLYKDFL